MLLENGFMKVTPMRGGLEAWVAAGYPLDTSMPVTAP